MKSRRWARRSVGSGRLGDEAAPNGGGSEGWNAARRKAPLVFLDGSLIINDRRYRRGGWEVVVLTVHDTDQAKEADLEQAWYGDFDGG